MASIASPSDEEECVKIDKCDLCFSKEKVSILQCMHHLCLLCIDTYCPLCLQFIRQNDSSVIEVLPNGVQTLCQPYYTLRVAFVFGFLHTIEIMEASINCRLECAWCEDIFNIYIYKGRVIYYADLPLHPPRLKASTDSKSLSAPPPRLVIRLIPPNLQAPKFKGTLCSWKFYLEMFPVCLDRPEVRHMSLLPDTLQDFLQQHYESPQMRYQLWQFVFHFPKYGSFFFLTPLGKGQTTLLCPQCGIAYATIEDLANSCLGGASCALLEKAVPLDVHFKNGLVVKAPTTVMGYSTYAEYRKAAIEECRAEVFRAEEIRKVAIKNVSNSLASQDNYSILCNVNVDPAKGILSLSAIKYLRSLLAVDKTPKFICYDLLSNDQGILTQFTCWLCWPLKHMPDGMTVQSFLGKFDSCLYLSLHRHIMKFAEAVNWGKIARWGLLQAASIK
jgi:hypothetical protein